MRGLLRLFVLIVLVNESLSCGRGRKKKGKPSNAPPEEGAGGPGDAINNLLGPITISQYSPSGDGPTGCDGLECHFEDACCWSNAFPPTDQLQWVKGSGQPDAAKLKANFNTESTPEGSYLVTGSDEAGSDTQSAQFYSCPIQCTGSDITVKLKHWTTKTMKLEVCTEQDPGGPAENCQPVQGDNGNSDSVTLPKGGENSRILIKASGFTAEEGSVAIISDIEVQCDPCVSTTQAQPTEGPVTTAGPTAGPSTAPPVASTVCKDLQCDFEDGSLCNYQPSGTANVNWANQQNPFHNRLTGVPKNGQGSKFAGTYTKAKQGEKSSMAAKSNFDKDYVIKYKHHMDTDGVTLKGCCDDESKCTPAKNPAVEVKDYQSWQTGGFSCATGTKTVMFVCDNTKGANEGACAVDDIQVFEGNNVESASQSACSGSAGPAPAHSRSRS